MGLIIFGIILILSGGGLYAYGDHLRQDYARRLSSWLHTGNTDNGSVYITFGYILFAIGAALLLAGIIKVIIGNKNNGTIASNSSESELIRLLNAGIISQEEYNKEYEKLINRNNSYKEYNTKPYQAAVSQSVSSLPSQPKYDLTRVLEYWQSMYQNGTITEEEYKQKREELINNVYI